MDTNIELSYIGSLPEVLKIFFTGVLFYMQMGVQQLILIAFLNLKYNNQNMVIAIGSANTQLFLVFYPLFFGINVSYCVLGSNDFGAKKHYLFGLQLNRCRFYAYTITLVVGIIYMCINKYVGDILQLTPEVQNYAFIFISFKIAAIFFEYEFLFLITYLQIIGKGLIGTLVLIPSILLFPVFCYIFIYVCDIQMYGPSLTCLFYNLTTAIIYWALIFILGRNPDHILMFNKDTFSEFWYLVVLTTPLYIINLLDNFNDEVMSIFANYQGEHNYEGFIVVYSVYKLMATFGNAANNTTNIIISSLMGVGLHERAKQFTKYMFISYNAIAIIIFLPVVFLKEQIIGLITSTEKSSAVAHELYYYALLTIFIEIQCSTFYALFVSAGRFYLALFLFFGFTCFNTSSIALFLYVANIEVKGIFIGQAVAKTLMIILYSIIYLLVIDWEVSSKEINKEIEEAEKLALEQTQ